MCELLGMHYLISFCALDIEVTAQVGAAGDLAVGVGVTQTLLDAKTVGLLGNINGNKDDDLETPDGTVLQNNINEETLYYSFGQACTCTIL